MSRILYLKIEQCILVPFTSVKIGDVAVMECTESAIINRLKTEKLLEVDQNPNNRKVVSVMYVIQKIHTIYPELEVQNLGESDFIEIYVKTSLEICESRDVKGLYKKARQGFILNFTGVSAPYEPPLKPEIVIDTEGRRLEESLAELLKAWDIYMETQYGCI